MTRQQIESQIKEIEQKLSSPSFLSSTPTGEILKVMGMCDDLEISLGSLSVRHRKGTYMDKYRFLK